MSSNTHHFKKLEELFSVVDKDVNLFFHSKIKDHLDSNYFYRAIIENGEDLIKVINQNGQFEFIGPTVESILGYKEEELLGKSIFPLIHPSDILKAKNLFNSLDKEREYKKVLFKFLNKNSQTLYLESYCYFTIIIDNYPLYVLICKNITERKRKEKQLKASKLREEKTSALFRKLLESSPDIISLWNATENKLVYYNQKKPFGYDSADELNLLHSIEIIHPDDRQSIEKYRFNLVSSAYFEPPSIEFRLQKKDGSWEWLKNIDVILERNERGLPTLVLSRSVVITDLKKTQENLENSKVKMQAILENTNERIWSLDDQLRITAANRVFLEEYKRYCKDIDPIGTFIFDYDSDFDRSKWEPLYHKALTGEAFTEVVKYEYEGKDRYFETSFNPIVVNGKVEGIACFNREITGLMQSEADLKQLNYELDSFVYRASHDMLAPLKSVLGLVSILRMELSSEEKEKYLDLVEKSIKKLDVFIHDLTSFSRNSRLPIVGVKIDFEEIINTTLENLGYMENANKILVKTEIDEREPFYSDKARIQIIFQNFISNSIKYQRPNIGQSELKINISCDSRQAIIELKDNGKGIRQEYLPKIFDMFFRASQDAYGSGLGLYITKQAIEKLNGKILNVESVYGEGTSFAISIPGSTSVD